MDTHERTFVIRFFRSLIIKELRYVIFHPLYFALNVHIRTHYMYLVERLWLPRMLRYRRVKGKKRSLAEQAGARASFNVLVLNLSKSYSEF